MLLQRRHYEPVKKFRDYNSKFYTFGRSAPTVSTGTISHTYRDLLPRVMKKYFKPLVLVFALVCLSLVTFGQSLQNHPPQPEMASQDDSHRGPPCNPWKDREIPSGNGNIPPPVGLCLPINDYLLPLLLCGIILGSYAVFVTSRPQPISLDSSKNSTK